MRRYVVSLPTYPMVVVDTELLFVYFGLFEPDRKEIEDRIESPWAEAAR